MLWGTPPVPWTSFVPGVHKSEFNSIQKNAYKSDGSDCSVSRNKHNWNLTQSLWPVSNGQTIFVARLNSIGILCCKMLQRVRNVSFSTEELHRNESKGASGIAHSLTAVDECQPVCTNNSSESMRCYWQAADKRWTLLLDTPTQSREATRHNTECRGTALPALTTVTLRSMGTGEHLTPYRIKILESSSKKPQLIRSTRGTNMPNLNKHLGEKTGENDQMWHFVTFIFFWFRRCGQTPERILTFNVSKAV